MKILTLVTLAVIGFSGQFIAHAEESTADKMKDDTKQAVKDTKHSMKKAGRAASDEACPIVNGKAKCAAKKVKHKLQNATDGLKE
jgi:hypothetical protein